MKSIWTRSVIVLVGLALLPSCTARYQQMLRDKDDKIRDLYTQIAELTATNQDLDARERGARARVATLEQRLAALGHDGSWSEILADLDSLTETEIDHDDKRFLVRSSPRPAASLALRAAGVALPPTVRSLADA